QGSAQRRSRRPTRSREVHQSLAPQTLRLFDHAAVWTRLYSFLSRKQRCAPLSLESHGCPRCRPRCKRPRCLAKMDWDWATSEIFHRMGARWRTRNDVFSRDRARRSAHASRKHKSSFPEGSLISTLMTTTPPSTGGFERAGGLASDRNKQQRGW